MEGGEFVDTEAVVTSIFRSVMQDRAVGTHTRRHHRATRTCRPASSRSGQGDGLIRLVGVPSGGAETLARDLVARRNQDISTRLDEVTMRFLNDRGLIQKCSRSPQGPGDIEATPTQLSREPSVEDDGKGFG